MSEQKNISTGGPAKEQAPVPSTDSTAQTTQAPQIANPGKPAEEAAASSTPDTQTNSIEALAPGYLSEGSMVDVDGALRPEYIGLYAQALAEKLKPLKATAFQAAFLKEAKEARKKKVPYGVKKNCTLGMVTQAKKLVHRKKDPAPRILVDMIQAATATVKDPDTFEALYMHLDAVYSYLLE